MAKEFLKKVLKKGRNISYKFTKKGKRSNNSLNRFFDKIYVINLKDRPDRWKKVDVQFKKRDIDVDRFIAIDGRCKNLTNKECNEKKDKF